MKIYKITFNKYDYDQYDSFIVSANTEADAVGHIKLKHPKRIYGVIDWDGGYKVEEIKPDEYTETTIINSSFNAG